MNTMSVTTAGRKGFRPARITAGNLAKSLGPEFTVWTSFGHVNGVEMFGKDAMVLDGEHVNVIAAGRVIIKHPLDRKLRILVK